jgi:hypothetical protein
MSKLDAIARAVLEAPKGKRARAAFRIGVTTGKTGSQTVWARVLGGHRASYARVGKGGVRIAADLKRELEAATTPEEVADALERVSTRHDAPVVYGFPGSDGEHLRARRYRPGA